MSIQYTVPGFEPTTFGRESLPITTRPGLLYLLPYKVLQNKLLRGGHCKLNLSQTRFNIFPFIFVALYNGLPNVHIYFVL